MPSPSGTGTATLVVGSASPTLAFTMPATGARRAVVAFLGCFDAGGAALTGATYGGVSLGTPVATFGAMATGLVNMYVLVNPPTGANNYIVNANAALDEAVLAIGGFIDVDQTTPAVAATGSNSGNGTTSGNLSATLGANEYLVGGSYCYSGAAHTITPSGTQIAEREATGNESGVGIQYGTASPINWTYSSAVDWFIAGVRLLHDAGATPPTITDQPDDVTAFTGQTANFSVTATGGTLTYQWQRDTGGGWVDISGATSSSYTTPSLVLADDADLFRCRVTDSGGTTDSNSALLTVRLAASLAWYRA